MKKSILILLIIFGVLIGWRLIKGKNSSLSPSVVNNNLITDVSEPKVIAEKLQIPWSLVFLPDRSILFTERPGRVRKITSEGILIEGPLLSIKEVKAIGEGGLLGIEIHPDFEKNHFLYFYYTYLSESGNTLNRVVRYTYNDNSLIFNREIVNGIPGNTNHNGGRLKFGPDGYLYITTGDSQSPSLAQDNTSLAGKVLRVTDEGESAPGNPFNNLVYSYGHRNPQGLAWDDKGQLWETEHGSSTGDEINLIEKGKNYGWPEITKTKTKAGMVTPVINSENHTWAPSGLVFVKPFLYFSGLRSSSLFRLGTTTMKFDQFIKGKYGRLRDVVLGPDGFLYITTSNMDGRSLTHLDGDKIIRIDPKLL